MAQVGIAAGATHFHPDHAVRGVAQALDALASASAQKLGQPQPASNLVSA
jgi:hypothetical protein